MNKLVAAMDSSGDPTFGNDKFLAIVIGTDESISSIFKKLGHNHIHMSNFNKKKQSQIISKLSFDSENNIAFCIRIDRYVIVNKINQLRKTKQKNISKGRIYYLFNRALFKQLRNPILEFLSKYDYTISDIIFECDSDCVNFAKDVSLPFTNKGKIHMISDIVAWANNKNIESDGVIQLDLRNKISTILKNI